MSCSDCTPNGNKNGQCLNGLSFKAEENYLAPYIGGVPIEPIDLQPIVMAAETDTQLQLDVPNKKLVYTGERAQNGVGSPDSVLIASMAALMQMRDLGDVEYNALTNGDLMVYNNLTGQWESYTVPEGTVVSQLGLNAEGKPVKQLSANPLPDSSVEVPLGGGMLWTAPEQFLPSNFVIADGRQLSRGVYAGYFSLVGTSYGPGNGNTTFNIPNISGRIPVGLDVNQTEFNALGKSGGEKAHALTANENGTHAHGVYDPGHNHGVYDPGHSHAFSGSNSDIVSGQRNVEWSDVVDVNAGRTTHEGTGIVIYGNGTGIGIYNSGLGTPHNNLQPFIALHYAIRVI